MRYLAGVVLAALVVATVAMPVAAGELASIARSETLWIFDADFEDLVSPDNLGWTSIDYSGTTFQENHWHKDTIRLDGFEHLGDSTWWCGMVDTTGCWEHPRGYGNDWHQEMWRDFALGEWSSPGDAVTLEWDQRYAMEHDYDYGYVDLSEDGGASWQMLVGFNDWGFAGRPCPGYPCHWDGEKGHPELDLTPWAGVDVRIRFRFESDGAYSPQDQWSYPSCDDIRDGAWQLDNVQWKVNGSTVWLDDCESPGDNGWQHPDRQSSGQTGTLFRRSLETVMGEPRWMMVAYDGSSRRVPDDHDTFLLSPPIDISNADDVTVQWSGWIDMPEGSGDFIGMCLHPNDNPECLGFFVMGRTPIGLPGSHTGGPEPFVLEYSASWPADSDWMIAGVRSKNRPPAASPDLHGAGFMLDRLRVGVPLDTHVPEDPIFATRLLAPSPNPFNPTTTIAYTLASPGRVTIRVHDIAGRVVRTLVDEERSAGEHATVWDGRTDSGDRAASGVYFVRMTADPTAGHLSDGDGSRKLRQQKLVLLK